MILLTIDTDWAPDEATQVVLEKVKKLGVKTTVFFSTPSPVEPWPLLETGCHPDLSRRQVPPMPHGPLAMARPEHDAAVAEAEGRILADYRKTFPEAEAIRTHRFYWHSDLSRLMAGHGFVHDSSMIMPFHPGLRGFKNGRLKRWPVWSSDHLHLARKLPLDRLAMPNWDAPGLKIFCFHVAYLYLNASSLGDFNMITQRLAGESAPVSQAPGVWDLFESLGEKIYRESGGHWLRDIPGDYLVDATVKECV
ncbi:MAG: hypothetical protein LBV79_00475 [Candidatus Adiutrix sp.]|jgi:hypothetical protein|nr:hypothetical protein [Candidatus Adiutrix sp.]